MERGNTKHGPVRDEQMAHETEGMVRGAPQRAHAEEWRENEPLDGADPAAVRPEATAPRLSGRDFDLRSELARILTRDVFPADRCRRNSACWAAWPVRTWANTDTDLG